jgi:hypothetical protein
MTSPYRPSPFTSHPTVVMPDTASEAKPKRRRIVRYALYVALVLSIVYAIWAWTT